MTFSYDGPNAVTVRPPHKVPATSGNWAKDVTAPGSGDGTVITASLLNMIVGNLRRACEGMGIALTEGADDLLLRAMQAALANPSFSGIPTAPTATPPTDTDQIATTAFVHDVVGIESAQTDDDIADLYAALDSKAPISSPVFVGTVTLPGDPLVALGAATKQYVDTVAAGFKMKLGCKAATTGSLAALSAPQTVDGVALVAGDRVLVKNQAPASANGLYVVAAGAWTRATDFDQWTEIPGALCPVDGGTVNGKIVFVCTAGSTGTIGTDPVTFSIFSVLGLAIAAIGALTPVADTFPYFNTGTTAALANLTAFGRALLNLSDAAAARGIIATETLGEIFDTNLQSASYTLVLADKGKMIEVNNAGANTLTIPAGIFPVNSYVNVMQAGVGQTTINSSGTPITLRSRVGYKLGGQYAIATLFRRDIAGPEEWVVSGDLMT